VSRGSIAGPHECHAPVRGSSPSSCLAPATYDLVAATEDGRVGVLADFVLADGEPRAECEIAIAPSGPFDIAAPSRTDAPCGERHLLFLERRGDV